MDEPIIRLTEVQAYYKSGNASALAFYFGDVVIYFSYNTPVAIRTPNRGLEVHENVWGPTTGKHLDAIDNGRKWARLGDRDFTYALTLALETYDLLLPLMNV